MQTLRIGAREFTLDDCRRYVGLYNTGYHAPAMRQLREMDQGAYDLFAGGLSRELPLLVAQLGYIAEVFGAARSIPVDAVARVIAERVLATPDYFDVLGAAPVMASAPVSAAVVRQLVAPFVGLPEAVGVKRHFPVWASKVLHFAAMDRFPTFEDATVTILGMPYSVDYPDFVTRFRPAFLDAVGLLEELAADDPDSPTLLRRFDKLLYQYGLEIKDRSNCR